MALKYNLTGRREYWTTVELPDDQGEAIDVRVKYWLLSPDDANAQLEHQLKISKLAREGEGDHVDILLDDIGAEERAKIRAQLCERILDWDIEDGAKGDGSKLPISADTIGAIYDHDGVMAQALYNGLMMASRGLVAAKKTRKRG
jgi:hypothetical protein